MDKLDMLAILASELRGELELYVELNEDRLDSMWYGPGQHIIASRKMEDGRTIDLYVSGEIKVVNEKGLYVYDGKERNSGFDFELETDEDWKRVYNSKKYEVIHNNWFEIIVNQRSYSDPYSYLDNALLDLIEFEF